jgi:hypothetical protein
MDNFMLWICFFDKNGELFFTASLAQASTFTYVLQKSKSMSVPFCQDGPALFIIDPGGGAWQFSNANPVDMNEMSLRSSWGKRRNVQTVGMA